MELENSKIPIIALCGFLGAGKTTLLNHILQNQNGRKIAVVINDFGSINVDSMLITSQTEDTVELSNGSICCVVGEGGIDEVIGSIAQKYSIIDIIIIEASGAAEPTHLVQQLTALRNDYAQFDSLLYVVDGHEFANTQEQHPEIAEHIKSADCIVLNKMDSVDDEQKQQLKDLIGLISPRAFVVESSYGKVDVESLLGAIDGKGLEEGGSGTQLSLTATDDHDHDHHHDHSHIHDSLTTNTFESTKPMDPKLLLQFFDNPPAGLYRLKGWIDFGKKGMDLTFIVQMVGSRWQMHLHRGNEEFDGTQLLLIGNKDVDESAMLKRLEDCVDQNPDGVTKDTMIDIFKYDTEFKTASRF